jgi:hypothetical protein
MLIKQPQVRIISKEVALATGELVNAYFALITIEGRTEAKFLGIKPLEASQEAEKAASAPIALLENTPVHTFVTKVIVKAVETVSPYVSLDFLLASQPTRAPSFN